MTGVEQLTAKILEDAKKQAAERIKHAEREAQNINEQARQRGLVQHNQITTVAQEQADELSKRLISVAELDARKEKLQVKQELIATAFEEALNRLCSLPETDYFRLLLDLVVKGSTTGTEEILMSETDHQRLPADFISQVNQGVQKKGLPGSLELAKDFAEIKGGVILRTGDILINYSFEALLKQNYDEIAMEVASLLFS